MASKKINKKVFGLIGRNIDYSFSKNYFNEKFRRDQLANCSYENFDLDSIESIPSILSQSNLSGLNVTTPYKREVIRFLDYLSEPSKKMQAVNTTKATWLRIDVYMDVSVVGWGPELELELSRVGWGGSSWSRVEWSGAD